jgi:hypothetical protein
MPILAPIIQAAVKGASTTIGLAGEKYHDHKERKAALAKGEIFLSTSPGSSPEVLLNPLEPGAETANDERIWALDEASGRPPSDDESDPQHRPLPARTVSDLVHNVFASPIPHENRPRRLPYPIIIPQRRPGERTRGFAQAYPPDMEAFGMDQATFLRFLQSFHESSQAAPWLQALFISAQAVGFYPSHITMAVSISLSFAAGYEYTRFFPSSQLMSKQNGDRASKQIQSQHLSRPDEQGYFHAHGALLHGDHVQGQTQLRQQH